MTALVTRLATEDDVPAIFPLFAAYRRHFGYSADDGLARRYLSYLCTHMHTGIILGCRDEKPEGFIIFVRTISTVGMASGIEGVDFWVDPPARDTKLSKLLLDGLDAVAVADGAKSLCCLVPAEFHSLRRFYRRKGWAETSLVFLRRFLSVEPALEDRRSQRS